MCFIQQLGLCNREEKLRCGVSCEWPPGAPERAGQGLGWGGLYFSSVDRR